LMLGPLPVTEIDIEGAPEKDPALHPLKEVLVRPAVYCFLALNATDLTLSERAIKPPY
jgi:hypothetical protein